MLQRLSEHSIVGVILGTVRSDILGKQRENSMPGTLVVRRLQVDAYIPNDRESFRVLPGMRSNMKTYELGSPYRFLCISCD